MAINFLALLAGIIIGIWVGTNYSARLYKKALIRIAYKLRKAFYGVQPTLDVHSLINELDNIVKGK